MRHGALDRLERRGAAFEIGGGALQFARPLLRVCERGSDGARNLFEPVRGLGALLPELRRLRKMLAGLIEGATTLLELLSQHADTALDLVELAGAILQRPDRRVHRAGPAIGLGHRLDRHC